MADPRLDEHTPERYEDTRQANNPPNSMLAPSTRRAALWSYLGPVVVLFVVIGIALIYWANRGPALQERGDIEQAVGTAGNTTPGGFEPQGRPESTRDEIERRGGVDTRPQGPMPAMHDSAPLTQLSALDQNGGVTGRQVHFRNVAVDSAQGHAFWVRDGDRKVEVMAQTGAPQVKAGMKVSIRGVAQQDGARVWINATEIDIAD